MPRTISRTDASARHQLTSQAQSYSAQAQHNNSKSGNPKSGNPKSESPKTGNSNAGNPKPVLKLPVKLPPQRPVNVYARPVQKPSLPLRKISLKSDSPLPVDLGEDPPHHRWLLTTCVTGVIATLVIGGSLLGFFNGNTVSRGNAYAAAEGEEKSAMAPRGSIRTASFVPPSPVREVIAVRALEGDVNYPEITNQDLPYGDGRTIVLDSEIDSPPTDTTNMTTISKSAPSEPVDETFTLAQGRSLADELVDRGVTPEVAQSMVASIEPILPARMIKVGTEFELTLDRQQDFYGRDATFPVSLSFKPGPKETISVDVDDDGQFVASLSGNGGAGTSQYASASQFRVASQVGASLYGTAKDNQVPEYIISEFMRVFSYDVDLQRQVKPTDNFEIVYGNPLTGSSTKRKVLHYAQLTLNGRTKTYYRYVDAQGRVDYVDENGVGASKGLLKTPISGSKLTSGFGFRRHPLLGYTKMHTGLDFGAPSGTPIRAAAAGTVEAAGRHGAYGISVELRHTKTVETLYAHMSRMAAGLRSGDRVNQGQVIGYVGATGRATGPHLHYEVRLNERPVNPQTIQTTSRTQLAGRALDKFRSYKQQVIAAARTAISPNQVAQNGSQQ